MKRSITTFTLLVLLSLACGMQTAPAQNLQNVTNAEKVTDYEISAFAEKPVKMIITADALNVRTGAGTSYPAIDGLELRRGEVVTCLEMSGSWCRHWQGWSHSAWMEGIK